MSKMEKYLLSLIRLLLSVISPELRNGLKVLLDNLEKQAEKTPNEWDNLIVSMLKSVLLGDTKDFT